MSDVWCLFPFIPRAFKINELKAEVANHLAVLEKRVEREWVVSFLLLSFNLRYSQPLGRTGTRLVPQASTTIFFMKCLGRL